MVVETELYDVLGIAPGATETEIKKAYRKASLQAHPDKNPGDPDASAKFQEIAMAYETLSDPDARAAYDRYGSEGLGGGGMGGGGMDMDDIFSQMFGGMGGMGGGGPRRQRSKGADSVLPYKVTLEDLYNGRVAHFNLSKAVLCTLCDGTGGKAGVKPKKCVTCGGQGRVLQQRNAGNGMISQSIATCLDCEGEGEKIRDKDRCKKCKGTKTTKAKSQLDVRIERGMQDGQRIVFAGEADQEPGVAKPGDIIIKLALQAHATFEVRGMDLLTTCRVTLSEALLGFDRVVVQHLDGRALRVCRRANAVVRPGEVQRVQGEGMPKERYPDTKGDLYIRWEVEFPPDGFLGPQALHSDAAQALLHTLPPAREPLASDDDDKEALVDEVQPVAASIDEFGSNGVQGEEWEDESEEGAEGGGGGPQCAHQ